MIEDLFAGRSRFHNVFHYRAVTWGDQVAIAFLVDAAALISQQAVFKKCSYGPYKRILRRIIAEEGFHKRLGEDRMMRIAEGTALQRQMSRSRWTAGSGRRCSCSVPTPNRATCCCAGTSNPSATRCCAIAGCRSSCPCSRTTGSRCRRRSCAGTRRHGAGTWGRSTGRPWSARSCTADQTRPGGSPRRRTTGPAPRGCARPCTTVAWRPTGAVRLRLLRRAEN